MPAPSTHCTWPESSQWEVNESRRARVAATSCSPVTACARRDRPGLGEHLRAAQQRLARHARPVGALAADEFALDEDGGQPAPDGDVGDVLPGRPGPEDDDVVGLLAALTCPSCVGVVDWPPCLSTARDFAAAMRQYAAGVCLLTVRDDIDDVGTTVSSVMSVSADPPLVAVGLAAGRLPGGGAGGGRLAAG